MTTCDRSKKAALRENEERLKLMAVGVQGTADDIMLSPPQKLFERVYAYGAGITIANYDVTADGQRFLMVKDEATAGRLRMILNWSPGPSH